MKKWSTFFITNPRATGSDGRNPLGLNSQVVEAQYKSKGHRACRSADSCYLSLLQSSNSSIRVGHVTGHPLIAFCPLFPAQDQIAITWRGLPWRLNLSRGGFFCCFRNMSINLILHTHSPTGGDTWPGVYWIRQRAAGKLSFFLNQIQFAVAGPDKDFRSDLYPSFFSLSSYPLVHEFNFVRFFPSLKKEDPKKMAQPDSEFRGCKQRFIFYLLSRPLFTRRRGRS